MPPLAGVAASVDPDASTATRSRSADELRVDLAAHAVPDQPDRGAGDWRYDDDDHGLPRRRRRPHHRRPRLLDDRASSSTSTAEPLAGRAPSTGQGQSDDFTDAARPTSRRWCASSRSRSPSDAPTRFEKAVALQEWFREDGGFKYYLETPRPATAPTSWSAFLTEGDGGRAGYCEQFASAMAVMARAARHPGPGRGRLPRARPGRRPEHLGLQRLRPARLARAVLRRRPAGCASSRPRRAGPGRAGLHTEPTWHRTAIPRGPSRQPPQASVPPSRPPSASRSRATPTAGADAGGGTVRVPLAAGRRAGPLAVAGRDPARCCSRGPCAAAPRARGSAPATRRRSGRSCATPRSTSACPGRDGRSPRETRDALVDYLGIAGGPGHPGTPAARRGRRSRGVLPRWTGSCGCRAAALLPHRAAVDPHLAATEAGTCVASLTAAPPAAAAAGGVVAAVRAQRSPPAPGPSDAPIVEAGTAAWSTTSD